MVVLHLDWQDMGQYLEQVGTWLGQQEGKQGLRDIPVGLEVWPAFLEQVELVVH